ncbi:hypothetical protein [Micromonospora fulviviridis]
MITAPASGSPYWAQLLISVLGLFGGASGIGMLATVAGQRRKLMADTLER